MENNLLRKDWLNGGGLHQLRGNLTALRLNTNQAQLSSAPAGAQPRSEFEVALVCKVTRTAYWGDWPY